MFIVIITISCLILSNIYFPVIKFGRFKLASFWIIVSLGAICLLPSINIETIFNYQVNPLEILILFISLTIISLVLDEVGFFVLVANKICSKAKTQRKLFTYLFILISILTVFTSNDIIILTFTPFIIALCKKLNINPITYLFSEFVAANTFSIMFLIGNPTNIFIGLSFNITFIEYLKVMFLPSLLGGITAYLICYLIFRKELNKRIEIVESDYNYNYNYKIMIISLIHLVITTIFLSISSLINIKMWIVCLVFASSICLYLFFRNKIILKRTLLKAPWSLVPFILSMFIIITFVSNEGYTKALEEVLTKFSGNSKIKTVFIYGYFSIINANLINNIPMSLLFINVLNANNMLAIYAVIIGSNLGSYFTPIGALAGIMWMKTLKTYNINLSFFNFIKNGFIVILFVSIVTFLSLIIFL